MRVSGWFFPLAMVLSAAAFGGSARIELQLQPTLIAEAEYWPGESHKPAVLIQRGFLVTRSFPTVRRLAEALADEGYSVLTPTLTLGINRRQQSVDCEALHTHGLGDDVAELVAWTRWLHERSGKPPVLVGHSVGGVQVAAVLDAEPDLPVARAVLISLSYFGEEQGAEVAALLRRRAAEDEGARPGAMLAYALTYCRTYVTTPGRLLSYLAWDRERIANALTSQWAPVTVIYGGQDERIDRDWIAGLAGPNVDVRLVPGANHFFDLSHEFELLDEVTRAIEGAAL